VSPSEGSAIDKTALLPALCLTPFQSPPPLHEINTMAPLTSFNPHLGTNPKYCFPEENVLNMKEKAFSLSGDDFTIKTANGAEICRCKGKVLSISDKKGLYTLI
jgi:hypothetical protein